jgi:hypothetical protein
LRTPVRTIAIIAAARGLAVDYGAAPERTAVNGLATQGRKAASAVEGAALKAARARKRACWHRGSARTEGAGTEAAAAAKTESLRGIGHQQRAERGAERGEGAKRRQSFASTHA